MTDPTDEQAPTAEPGGASRRTFLTRVAAGGAVLAAGTQLVPITRLAPFAGAQDDGEGGEAGTELSADETQVAFLASIALACTEAYRIATDPTASPLPEPVLEVVRTFGLHHSGQAAGLNGLLPTPVEEPNATLLAEIEDTLGGAGDTGAMLDALAALEESVAATHFSAIASIEDQNDAAVVIAALPVVAQQVTVLRGLNGADISELVPETQSADGALTPAAYPVEASGEGSPATTTEPPPEGPESQEGGSGPEAGSGGGDPADPGSTGGAGDGTESSGGGGTDGSGTASDEG